MKKFLLFFVMTGIRLAVIACPACEARQPRLLRGIVHGRGPEDLWDYFILFTAILIFGYTLFYSVKYLVRPGETSGSHIKNFILNDE